MDLRAQFDRLIGPLRRRVLLMVGRAVVRVVDDSLKLQAVQVEALQGEVLDGIERWQEYGFSSVPHPGAEAIVAALGGQRQHSVVLAVEDRRYRVTGLEQGEVCIYTDEDDSDQTMPHRITLGRNRVIRLEAAGVSMEMDGDGEAATLTVGVGTFVMDVHGVTITVGSSTIVVDENTISLTAGDGATAVLATDADIEGNAVSLTAAAGATVVLDADVDIDGGRIDLN